MANEQDTTGGADEQEKAKRARKVEVQREYLRRKLENETQEDRAARLEKQKAYHQNYMANSPDKYRAKVRRANQKQYASDPEKCKASNRKSRKANGVKWNETRRKRYAKDTERAERLRAACRRWREQNREAVAIGQRRYWAANAERLKDENRKWREQNPERHLENAKRWRDANLERAMQNLKAWRAANPGYAAERLRSDPYFKLVMMCRGRVSAAIRRQGTTKCRGSLALIGCSRDALIAHIEAQFQTGMTWENYGKHWHVDHIMPVATFDLTDPAQQLACFHYTNLRPLTVKENLSRRRHPRYYPKAA